MHFTRFNKPRTLAFLLVLSLLFGCASLDEIAPPIHQLGLTLQPSLLANVPQLEQGRQIYITSCTRCHSPERITRYSRLEWDEILPEMILETKLDRAEAEAVEAYVSEVLKRSAARQSPPAALKFPPAQGAEI